jgi:uncharacterized protein (TIGR03437 family)
MAPSVPLDISSSTVDPAFNADGRVTVNRDGTVNTPANPARLGSIVSIYATGLGTRDGSRPPESGRRWTSDPIPPPYILTGPHTRSDLAAWPASLCGAVPRLG